jgi:hypothetical protein
VAPSPHRCQPESAGSRPAPVAQTDQQVGNDGRLANSSPSTMNAPKCNPESSAARIRCGPPRCAGLVAQGR